MMPKAKRIIAKKKLHLKNTKYFLGFCNLFLLSHYYKYNSFSKGLINQLVYSCITVLTLSPPHIGYSNDFIKKSFIEASTYLQNKYKNKRVFIDKTKEESGTLPNSTLLYHRQYHPRAIPQHAIRDAFNRAFKNTNLFEAILICNSRPRNIRDILMPSDLPNRIGKNPSDYINNL